MVSAVFQDLLGRGFDDPRGVPTAEWHRFLADVLPRTIAVIDAPPSHLIPALHGLAPGYHSSL